MLYLFDIDGTLLWTGGAGAITLEAVFHRHFGVLGAMAGVSAGGKTDPMIIDEMFVGALGRRGTNDEIAVVLADYEAALPAELERAPRFRTLPHVESVLGTLHVDARVTLAIATGNSEAGAQAKLERAALTEFFVCGGYGSDSADRGELVAKAIDRAEAHAGRGFDRKNVVVVGDTPRDITAARACGVRVVAVATGHPSKDELAAERPDAVIDELDGLLAWHAAHCAAAR